MFPFAWTATLNERPLEPRWVSILEKERAFARSALSSAVYSAKRATVISSDCPAFTASNQILKACIALVLLFVISQRWQKTSRAQVLFRLFLKRIFVPNDFLFAVGMTLARVEHFCVVEHFSCQVIFFVRLAWNFICKKFLTRTHRARPGLYIALYRFVYSAIQSWV